MSQPESAVPAQPLMTVPPRVAAPPRPAKAALPLLLAVWLGVAAHLLTRHASTWAGLNLSVWISVFAALSVWVVNRSGGRASREGVTLLGVAVAFAWSFTLRAVPDELAFLNGLALLLSLLLGAATLRFPSLSGQNVGPLLGVAFTGWLRLFYGPLALLERFPWPKHLPSQRSNWQRWGLGTLLTVPVLVVFGSLLANADQSFARLISSVTNWRFDDLISEGTGVVLWTALAAGLLYPAIMALRPSLFPEKATDGPRLGLIEVGLPLGSLAALFIVFLLTQLPYFLSGTALPDGLTFAEYIRKGFGELMTVAFLTLALLLGTHGITREDIRIRLTYRLLNLAVLAPLALVILSAANRWRLYTLAYGLSDIRVTGAAFLVWVTLALAWLAWLLWRGDLKRFTYPALLAGFGTLLVTTALNPAALIARVNIERQTAQVTNHLRTQPQQANVDELLYLGAGAVPAIVQHLNILTQQDCHPSKCSNNRQVIIDQLHDRYDTPREWRTWNAAYAHAHALVRTLPPRSNHHRDSYRD